MKRSPLKRKTPLRAKRWGVQRKARGTAHSRRPRELGFMAYAKFWRGCELRRDAEAQRMLGIVHLVCDGSVEFAHLHDRKRYAKGDVGAGLCKRGAHTGIDGRVGGKMPEYVALGRDGQKALRDRLSNGARAGWNALPPETRAWWDRWARQDLLFRREVERAAREAGL